MKKRCLFDQAFKRMAVELAHAKVSVQEAARELGIDSSRITKWRHSYKSPGQSATPALELSEDQKMIKRLQKELKDAQLERDMLKKAISIFSRIDERYSSL
ncbi:transposase [Larkinella sp. GY13]|uniref:transposase n=1 Tax=Larkinella sp. GY13 TaxID=3453720 RepID=UPI003EEAC350